MFWKNKTFPVSWGLDNLQLLNQNYSINVFEEDGVFLIMIFVVLLILKGFSNSATLNNGDLVVNIQHTEYNQHHLLMLLIQYMYMIHQVSLAFLTMRKMLFFL